MKRFRFIASYLARELPHVWWDAFVDLWAWLAEMKLPEQFAPDVDYGAFQHAPAVDFGGGD